MSSPSFTNLSAAGRSLLDRRSFLGHLGSGLAGVALQKLLADDGPIRPSIRSDAPLAPRVPHFAPRAKRVVMIFSSGACSQLDTWDYKPELIARHGQPMPGLEDLITFQGEQGALARSARYSVFGDTPSRAAASPRVLPPAISSRACVSWCGASFGGRPR